MVPYNNSTGFVHKSCSYRLFERIETIHSKELSYEQFTNLGTIFDKSSCRIGAQGGSRTTKWKKSY